ncbi:hypothetical protein, partial [uncultured Muribaculum sp.]
LSIIRVHSKITFSIARNVIMIGLKEYRVAVRQSGFVLPLGYYHAVVYIARSNDFDYICNIPGFGGLLRLKI